MKILSNKKYHELTSRISTLEKAVGEHDVKQWNAGYDTGMTSGRAEVLANTRQQFIEKLRAAYLKAPSEQMARLLLGYDTLPAPANASYCPPPHYYTTATSQSSILGGIIGTLGGVL